MTATPMTAEEAYERERRARPVGPSGVPFPTWAELSADARMGWENRVRPSRVGDPIPAGDKVFIADDAGDVIYAIEKWGEKAWKASFPPRHDREFGLRTFNTRRGAVRFVEGLIGRPTPTGRAEG